MFDFSKDYYVPFGEGKFNCIVATGEVKIGEKNNRQYIEHEFKGKGGETMIKKFYPDTEGGRRFYTWLLGSCGVSAAETKNWSPEKLIGKFVDITFKNSTYTTQSGIDSMGNEIPGETKESIEIRSFSKFTGTKQDEAILKYQLSGADAPF